MAEKQNIPEIRFEGFTDPWEQRKLNEYLETSREKNESCHFGKDDVLSVSGDYGIVNQIEFQGRSYAGTSVANYGVVHKGDVVYTKSPLRINPYGIIKTNRGNDGIVSTLYAVYHPTEKTHPDFVQVYFEQNARMNNYMAPLVSKGAKNDMKVSAENALKGAVTFPGIKEQEVIASYFSQLDDLITLHQRKYDKLCTVKKSMLDKMFPKPGETEPEIRFEGFTDPWEQRKLGSIAASFDYGLNAAATEYDGQNKYLRITDIDDTTHEFLKSDLTTPLADLAMSADYLLEEGDLLFARTGASVGKTYLYRQYDGTIYFAGFLIRARIGESADPEFVYQATLTDAYKKYVAITSQRSGQPGVNAQEYADYQLMLPSRTEQQQIGMTLRSLDNLITLHQRKLELLRNIKKSLLDRMFV